MQISGDCATLGWNRSMKQLDVKDVLPNQQMREEDVPPVSAVEEPKVKRQRPKMSNKKKDTIGDGYQKMKDEGLIANLDEDLA